VNKNEIKELKQNVVYSLTKKQHENFSSLLSQENVQNKERTLILIYLLSNYKDYLTNEKIDIFLSKGIDHTIEYYNGKQLLHLAVYKNNNYLVEKLLLAGASPNIKDHKKYTPFSLALYYKNKEAVELMLNYKIENFYNENNENDLYSLAIKFTPIMWERMVEKGIKSVDFKNQLFNENTIVYGIYKHKSLAKKLIEYETVDNLNKLLKYNNTLLHIAASNKQYDMINILIDKKVDLNVRNIFNESVLDCLVVQQSNSKLLAVIKKLLSNGCQFKNEVMKKTNQQIMNMIKDKDILRTIVDYEKELLMANFDIKQKNTLKRI
jgi:ankyrin repeat protein